jgi:8-oxo-dGTP diphosphatase
MKLIRVAAGILIRENKVLVTRRKPGATLAGYWEFPGGKIEPGEAPEQCLERELEEELGLPVQVLSHYATGSYDYPFGTVELHVYLCSPQGEPTRLESHDLIEWATQDELRKYQWAPADIFAVEKLMKEGIPK